MRTGVDALRSIHRYVWRALSDDSPVPTRDEPVVWSYDGISTVTVVYAFLPPGAKQLGGAYGSVLNFSDTTGEGTQSLTDVVGPPGPFEMDLFYDSGAGQSRKTFTIGVAEGPAPLPIYKDEQRDWEIRYWGTEGEFRFPFARIAAITPVTYTGSAVVREAARTFAVHAYPVPKDSPEESIMEVERVEEILTIAFETGFSYIDKPTENPVTWLTVAGHPHRIPLYDYDGVPLDGPSSVSYARGPSDYLKVVSCPISRITDPEDDRYWLVTAEPRVTWRRRGRVPADGGKIVQSVQLEQVPS